MHTNLLRAPRNPSKGIDAQTTSDWPVIKLIYQYPQIPIIFKPLIKLTVPQLCSVLMER